MPPDGIRRRPTRPGEILGRQYRRTDLEVALVSQARQAGTSPTDTANRREGLFRPRGHADAARFGLLVEAYRSALEQFAAVSASSLRRHHGGTINNFGTVTSADFTYTA